MNEINEKLLDVELGLDIEFASASIDIKTFLGLDINHIIKLDKLLGESSKAYINEKLFADIDIFSKDNKLAFVFRDFYNGE